MAVVMLPESHSFGSVWLGALVRMDRPPPGGRGKGAKT